MVVSILSSPPAEMQMLKKWKHSFTSWRMLSHFDSENVSWLSIATARAIEICFVENNCRLTNAIREKWNIPNISFDFYCKNETRKKKIPANLFLVHFSVDIVKSSRMSCVTISILEFADISWVISILNWVLFVLAEWKSKRRDMRESKSTPLDL